MAWDLSGDERTEILGSLTEVGCDDEAIGYLPLPTLRGLGSSSADLIKAAAAKGLAAIHLHGDACCINGGALYVYDHRELSKLLTRHSVVLSKHGWPVAADRFVRMLAKVWLPESHPVTEVIRIAFGSRECRGK